jgi:hypothetical protein
LEVNAPSKSVPAGMCESTPNDVRSEPVMVGQETAPPGQRKRRDPRKRDRDRQVQHDLPRVMVGPCRSSPCRSWPNPPHRAARVPSDAESHVTGATDIVDGGLSSAP